MISNSSHCETASAGGQPQGLASPAGAFAFRTQVYGKILIKGHFGPLGMIPFRHLPPSGNGIRRKVPDRQPRPV